MRILERRFGRPTRTDWAKLLLANALRRNGLEFCDLRYQHRHERVIALSGEASLLFSQEDSAIGLRVIRGGKWGFSSSSTKCLNSKEIYDLVDQSSVNAAYSSKTACAPQNLAVTHIVTCGNHYSLKELEKYACSTKKGLGPSCIQLTVQSEVSRCTILNSLGVDAEAETQNFYVTANFFNSALNGTFQRQYSQRGTPPPADGADPVCLKFLSLQRESLVAYESQGRTPVVLDPELTGLLTHEIVGHSAEADNVLESHSPFAPGDMGSEVAASCVTVVDDPTGPEMSPATSAFDAEAIPCRPVTILENGRLVGLLHSMQTSSGPGDQAGSARCETAYHEPLPRMSNTRMLAGTMPPGGIAAELGSGIALFGALGSGFLEDGAFYVDCMFGRLIRGGQLKEYIGPSRCIGSINGCLNGIALVGADFEWTYGGRCGKKNQSIATWQGAPSVAIQGLRVHPIQL